MKEEREEVEESRGEDTQGVSGLLYVEQWKGSGRTSEISVRPGGYVAEVFGDGSHLGMLLELHIAIRGKTGEGTEIGILAEFENGVVVAEKT